MKKVALAVLALCLLSCGDNIIDTAKSVSTSNTEFTINLSISDEIVRLDDSIKLTAKVERKVHKDSISDYISTKMIMDQVGGSIDVHGFTSASNIIVALDDEKGSTFEVLAFFLPTYKYNSTKKEYYDFKEKGHVSVVFDGMSVSLPVNMVVPR
ncbi:MAG: hypothetical protein HOA15_02795 [Candidatus Marinimicrobia bacterium]|nr:hypothetical protein [Candidatus Neomarinimicrobiota bacterium]MBT4371791.1 hypothetical protein [Candidatus Neomarinimicrobiota bacterium]MBT4808964.1 hypothetical protein [Candidatus Neomarinimicrobiota bacterium]MBT6417639.1 hypothetical protein [Candidatus Neomarinimicrobiota bacterium]MBT6840823.1 hypothetical protein [Candidatus Neomarinimicrobiota bacterium]